MYKDDTNDKLKDYYNKNGLERTLQVAFKMLELPNHKKSKLFRNTVHGELCECIAEICIKDFMKKHPEETKDWFYSKGMILKDIQLKSGKEYITSTKDLKKSRYLTELDLTLFTPYKALVLECKSYSGDKTFKDKCIVHRKGIKDYDVYNQHEKHYKTLLKNIKYFRSNEERYSKIAPIQIAYFDFSLGKKKDTRDKKWRAIMPILTCTNIDKLLLTFLDKPRCWDMTSLKKAVDIIDKNKKKNTEKHLAYVKSIHR